MPDINIQKLNFSKKQRAEDVKSGADSPQKSSTSDSRTEIPSPEKDIPISVYSQNVLPLFDNYTEPKIRETQIPTELNKSQQSDLELDIEYLRKYFPTLKNDRGETRFTDSEIDSMIKQVEDHELFKALEFLVFFKTGEGSPRFTYNEIINLIKFAKVADNRATIEFLAKLKNNDGEACLTDISIIHLIRYAQTEENRKAIEFIAKYEHNNEGRVRLGRHEIEQLIEPAKTEAGQKAIRFIASIKDESGKPMFNNIKNLIEPAKTEAGRKAINFIVSLKDKNGKQRFSASGMSKIIEKINDEKSYKALKYLVAKTVNDEPCFEEEEISRLIEAAKSEKGQDIINFLFDENYIRELNKNVVGLYKEEITNMFSKKANLIAMICFYSYNNYKFPQENYFKIIHKLATSTFKLAYKTPNQYLNFINFEYSNTDDNGSFPTLAPQELKEEQHRILHFFNKNLPLLVRALQYVDTDTINQMMDKRTNLFEKQLQELNYINDSNFTLLSRALNCKTLEGKPLTAKQKIELCQILRKFQEVNIDTTLLQTTINENKIDLDSIKQIINNKICERAGVSPDRAAAHFNEDYAYLLLMKDSIDEEINIAIDMHKEMLNLSRNSQTNRNAYLHILNLKLEDTSDKAGELYKEIIDMVQDIDKYSDMQILNKIIEATRISAQDNAESDKLFFCVKTALTKNFKEFIMDESNHYGRTNAKTRLEFEENGLNYYEWLYGPDELKFELNGEELSIRLWDRAPEEDLFLGNKTTCCTAIGTINGIAIPLYLLNTSFNIVELYDSNGNVVGMSRVFMAKVDDEPALIMDNIELNNTFVKDMSVEQKRLIRNSFFSYMNQYAEQVTGDKNTQVYFCTEDVRIPSFGLHTTKKFTDFIGSFSQELVYINSAGCIWTDPTQLAGLGEIEWYVVPKE